MPPIDNDTNSNDQNLLGDPDFSEAADASKSGADAAADADKGAAASGGGDDKDKGQGEGEGKPAAEGKAKAEEGGEDKGSPAKPDASTGKDDKGAAADDGAKDDKGDRDQVIPRTRFDEVHRKFKAEQERATKAEQEAAELRAQLAANSGPKDDKGDKGDAKSGDAAATEKVDIDALEEEYAAKLLDYDTKGAAEIRKKINAEIDRQATERATKAAEETYSKRELEAADKARKKAIEEDMAEFQRVAADSMSKYTFLDDKSADANPDAIAEVLALRSHYQTRMPLSKALAEAVAMVAPKYAKSAATSGNDQGDKSKVEDPRSKAAIERNIKDAEKQPPAANGGGIGNRAELGLIVPKTQKDWNALPDAERQRLLN